jgi:hypothetical protein
VIVNKSVIKAEAAAVAASQSSDTNNIDALQAPGRQESLISRGQGTGEDGAGFPSLHNSLELFRQYLASSFVPSSLGVGSVLADEIHTQQSPWLVHLHS